MRKSLLRILIVMALAVSCAWGEAWAFGPDWDEIGDAGATPAKAQRLIGAGAVQSISGALAFALASGEDEDLQDMYLVRIEQPTVITFSASTDTSLNGAADFDTRLWLFNADGFGLLANDDAGRSVSQSTLLDASTDGTGIIITKPGLYFLAVSGAGTEPFSGGDDDDSIFVFASPTEVSGPDGLGGGAPIEQWANDGDQGNYVIALTGVALIAPGDLNGDGAVNVDDLLGVINAWGKCADCVAAPCLADFNGDCVVNVDDLLNVINNWG